MMTSLLLLLSLVCGNLAADWNYNRCDKLKGPTSSAWGGQCSGSQNTPINLCGAVSFPSNYQSGFTLTDWNKERTVKILNSGYTVQIDIPDHHPTLEAGALSALVGRGTNTSTHHWVLQQMHVHFGRTGKLNEGSEHYLQGRAYPMEIHFVHYNAALGDGIIPALTTGQPEALLVVGIFIEVGAENPVLQAMANAVDTATSTPTALGKTVNLNDLFDGSGSYYSYAGGLTIPTCLEQVTWVVMKAPKSTSEGSLMKFKKATTTPATVASQKFLVQASSGAGSIQGDYGTFRSLQATNGRTVYSSDGSTATCGTVTEPTFNCNSGFLNYPSMLVMLLAGAFWMSQV